VCKCDAIEFVVPEPAIKDDILKVTGILADLNTSDNLVLKAVRKIREFKKIPFLKIHLHKTIPVGAGLGGGSSDAATMLKSLNRNFGIGLSNEKLSEISLELGSDCPFFIDGNPAFAKGRGELLETVMPIPAGFYLLLVNPGVHINTGEAYSMCTPKRPDSDLKELYKTDISKWKNLIINDFEVPVFRKYPQIADLKEKLYEMGAIYSSMSGSGSTVYGIFNSIPAIPQSIRKLVIYSDIL
jgi:4-diphosphocytidyl-2-C-methyl-D-erythritol kinase